MTSECKKPERSCIACYEKKDKRDLLRIVRSPQGEVSIDPSRKAAGRGAYLCRSEACIRLAKKQGKLQLALRTQVPERVYEDVMQQLEDFHDL